MTQENPILSLNNVGLVYQDTNKQALPILRNINLNIFPGETTSIMGPSGSGKTSLLMVSSGVEQATSGDIKIAGQSISHYDEDQLAQIRSKHLGIVFQNFHLVPTMTAIENIVLALKLCQADNIQEQANHWLVKVNLTKRAHHLPSQLSGGEQQRIALARGLSTNPDLLFADEPTGNLDHDSGTQIIDLLFELSQNQGTSVVMITHNPSLAALTSRQLQMQDGLLHEN